MLVYLAGPYSEYTDSNGDVHSVEDNIKEAEKVMVDIMINYPEVSVICPHKNTAGLEKVQGVKHRDWLRFDFAMLQRCDLLIAMPSYEYSQGTLREIEYANLHKIPWMIYDDEMLPENLVAQTEKRCPDQVEGFIDIIMQMYRLHLKKNSDYSPANVLGTAEIGLATRIWDKVTRLMNLTGFNIQIASSSYTQPREPKNESIDDTLIDLSVYGVIAQLYRKGRWGV